MGTELSAPIVQQAIDRVTYDGASGRVVIRLSDATRSEYTLGQPSRPGATGPCTERDGRVPRLSRLMALAIRMEGLLLDGSVGGYREMAELGQISRGRVSQILRLAELAPAIQEEILFLPKTRVGTDPVTESDVREVSRIVEWDVQLKQFRALMDSARNC